MNNKIGGMPKGRDGIEGLSQYERDMINRHYQQRETELISNYAKASKKVKGSADALRKYEIAKRDYAKASIFGKAYLKITGQANFKKMLAEANKGMSK